MISKFDYTWTAPAASQNKPVYFYNFTNCNAEILSHHNDERGRYGS